MPEAGERELRIVFQDDRRSSGASREVCAATQRELQLLQRIDGRRSAPPHAMPSVTGDKSRLLHQIDGGCGATPREVPSFEGRNFISRSVCRSSILKQPTSGPGQSPRLTYRLNNYSVRPSSWRLGIRSYLECRAFSLHHVRVFI